MYEMVCYCIYGYSKIIESCHLSKQCYIETRPDLNLHASATVKIGCSIALNNALG